MRSLLFVPGDSERKLAKGSGSGADVLIIDLEDSVAPAAKPAGRDMAAGFLRQADRRRQKLHVRVNALDTGLTEDDLAAIVPALPDAIMLPKCNGAEDVLHLAGMLDKLEAANGLAPQSIGLLPIITETAAGLLNAHSYVRKLPRLAGLTWGAEDLSADIGASTNRDEHGRYTDVFRLARATTVLAAAAAGVTAVDTVFVDFSDKAGFEAECRAAERDGFTAKMAIHPAQVEIINRVFTPSTDAVAQSQAIIAAFATAGDPGVVAIDGKMYDRPHLRRAQRILDRAKAAGVA